eukprot:725610-Rhodomonas_salina.1
MSSGSFQTALLRNENSLGTQQRQDRPRAETGLWQVEKLTEELEEMKKSEDDMRKALEESPPSKFHAPSYRAGTYFARRSILCLYGTEMCAVRGTEVGYAMGAVCGARYCGRLCYGSGVRCA